MSAATEERKAARKLADRERKEQHRIIREGKK
jgi:hypothetical protein